MSFFADEEVGERFWDNAGGGGDKCIDKFCFFVCERAVTIGGEEIGDETTIVEQMQKMQKMQKQREHEEKIISRPMFTSRYTFL